MTVNRDITTSRLYNTISATHLDTLCSLYRNINITYSTPHHNLYNLRRSAHDGCACCLFLYKNLNSARGEFFRDNITIWPDDPCNKLVLLRDRTLTYEFPMERGNLGSRFAFRNHDWLDVGDMLRTYELVVRDESLDLMGNKWVPRYLESDPTSEASFSIISSWLTDCVNSHERCRQSATTLPHMVLDLGNEDPILVLGDNREEHYVALSHCWGQRPPLQTTTTNLSSHMISVAFSELPKTFQDVVAVTRRLGIRYLWIDSLCIVQNDLADWRTESAKMAAYYQNAYITISALSSSDSHQGILGRLSAKTQLLLSAESQLYIRDKTPQLGSIFEGEPLNTSAWAFQERLLSTRIIHFSKKELIWECNTCTAREAGLTNFQVNSLGDDNIPPRLGNFGDDPKLTDPSLVELQLVEVPKVATIRTLDLKRLIIEGAAENISTISVWKHLVEEYMERKITWNTDRLPAIAGIAQTLFEGTRFTYLAGILKEWPSGLLWSKKYNVGIDSAQLDAPSWSWASATSRIRFFNITSVDQEVHERAVEYDAVIVDSNIECAGPDMFGQVSSGWISLSAYIFVPDVNGRDFTRHPYRRSYSQPFDVKNHKSLFVGIRGYAFKIVGIEVEPDPKELGAYRRVGRWPEVFNFIAGNAGERSSIILT